MKKILIVGLLISFSAIVFSQKLTSAFGKVTKEELEMKAFENDTTASAAVLYQSGHFDATTLKFTFFKRVKIFKKEGTEYAEFTFKSDEDTYVKGKTYNLVNGKIVEEKLPTSSIFKQRITDNYWAYRIAMPNVKVGTVIEIEYTQLLLPASFYFQDYIPLIRCELELETNQLIEFRKTMTGYVKVKTLSPTFFMSEYVPAFKSEIYTNSSENYIGKFDFDILNITVPGSFREFTTTWEAVNKGLMESAYFGLILKASAPFLNDIKDAIEKRCSTPLEKTMAAYEEIKKIKWNNEERLFTTGAGLRPQFTLGSGNSADINMMLYALLKKMEVKCSMLVMSTRENGMLHPVFPSMQKLNYSIVCAFIDGKEYPLDATDQYIPFGMLPLRCLNSQARLVDEFAGKWIDLTPSKKEKEVLTGQMKFNQALELEGEIVHTMYDYSAYNFRIKSHKYASEEKTIENIESSNPGLMIKEFKVTNLDSLNKECILKLNSVIRGKTQTANDLLLVNPFIVEQIIENPFKTEKRSYPVDFAVGRSKTMNFTIAIPEGYKIETLPKPLNLSTEGNALKMSIIYLQEPGSVSVQYLFEINKTLFLPTEYSKLRDFYNQLILKQSEPIILKKVTDANN